MVHKSIQELAPRISDCLKLIYSLQERGQKVSTSIVSEKLGVSDATVTMMFKDFATAGWVEHVPYHGVRLTELGERKAIEIIRHHRLLELYLARELGYTWDKVHEEADRLEHVISEEFEEKLDALLGYPTVDPHGDPIPSKDGVIMRRQGQQLSQFPVATPARIIRVSDQDSEKLCYLGKLGLYPEASIQIIERAPFNGPLRVLVGKPGAQEEHLISVDLAEHIVVTLLPVGDA
ncbi:transcriptional regulator [Ktedonobacter sp. SOSP1-85]|uniref:metal-dependent transcriptional regulator n=1 Tax=unclassified Ktedonobacter TaxID=388461 RepID=UPI001A251368|nr:MULTISPECIES: metal-dependent transcriptional regulator [unclassified Ktedonobacter]GHO64872.1 transcriptional regulator [Ktedonobacter sp. SOSP1-52]GHO77354.1 transcriptional regulator [Ktedonobacter sp. SOSP1-85]